MPTSADIRERFLSYFRDLGHTVVPSGSLLPASDPTLLFSNAGMVQFKDVFLGDEQRAYSRATTSQKCMRVSGKHNDLEAVGPSPRHHTFFEMLGNFSFGDYFKPEAIEFAWAFLTRELGLDPDRLHPTVHVDDDEALSLWQRIAGLPASRIARLGDKENFWAMGDTGPCGPCSEITYDRGPEACSCGNLACDLETDCDRWLELWNLVFMQFESRADGSRAPLPKPSIDTGMGLERIASVIQGADSNYGTDLFLPIMRRTQALLDHTDNEMEAQTVPYRVIADHSRAITFLIADGVLPGNEGRNYVLRLILRRAARFGQRLGFDGPFLAETAQAVIEGMGHHYAELVERRDFICDAITQEEERFLATLSIGLSRLQQLADELQSSGSTTIPGEEAFRLYDTYGFPLDLTRDAATEMGLAIDEPGFQRAMASQRERARSAQRFVADSEADLFRQLDLPQSEFMGHDVGTAAARVIALVKDGGSVTKASAGDKVDVILDRTPFYAESGGQVADTGELSGDRVQFAVSHVHHPIRGVIAHRGLVSEGVFRVGTTLQATVDPERRLDIARNHTATHLLHRALRQVLGEHAAQAGSLVAPNRLRFDFSHLSPMAREELRAVERIVNEQIRRNLPVSARVTSYAEAIDTGAIALFGEKYGDEVRVVQVEGFSTELCGGTHLSSTGQIGSLLIVSEASVGSGLRRIEALTGRGAEDYVRARLKALVQIGEAVQARPGDEAERVSTLVAELRDSRRTVQELQREAASRSVSDLLGRTQEVDGVPVLVAQVESADVDALREMCDEFRAKLPSAVVALGAVVGDRPMLVVALTQDLVARGLHAGKLAGTAAREMQGGGGGKPDMAQAGGRDATRLAMALDAIPRLVSQQLLSADG